MLGYTGLGTGHTMKQEELAVAADKYFKKIAMSTETLACIQINWSAATTGTMYVQGSNYDNPTDEAAGATDEWQNLDVVPNKQPVGGTERGCFFNIAYQGFRWIRVFYDFTSGTADITTRTVTKMLGA